MRVSIKPCGRRLALVAMALWLSACAAPRALPESPPASVDADWAQQRAALARAAGPGMRLIDIDAERSSLRIHVFRAGGLAALGHNHVLSAPRLHGLVALPAQGSAGARFALALRLDELSLDEPAQRAALGAEFASRPDAEAIAATRANMLGEAGLQAARFPWLRLRSLQVAGALPKLALQVEIELHGQRRAQWLPAHVELRADGLSARGAFVLRQSDFGLQPFSVLGGLLTVQDELLVEFELTGRAEGH